MRLVRAATHAGIVLARVDGRDAVVLAEEPTAAGADVLRQAIATGVDLAGGGITTLPVDDLRILSPVVNPSKLLAIGINYADHAAETGAELPKEPVIFVKTTNAICGLGDAIRIPAAAPKQVDYEAELAVVIGRRASDVAEADALGYVLGYTCCNDVSARDAQFGAPGGQWIRSKSFDTFAPMGPAIVTADEIVDPQSLAIRCVLDGETMQDSNTKEMVFGVAALIAHISRGITLEPGDVITTGTPAGVGVTRRPPVFLRSGATVTVEIDGIGALTNPVT
jgi:2-keto-4-pentenoate hydratase/2-oxohepta-3-ene-1,7-dioic acid hydratase in catechol pathway